MDDPADATRSPVIAARRALRLVAGLLAALLAIVLSYLAAAWIGSSLPRGGSVTGTGGGVTIFVETNGIHTGIVVPIAAAGHDWRRVFPEAGAPLPRDRLPTHVAIGYGEREVFLDTRRHGAICSVGTAMRVATLGGRGHDPRPAPGRSGRRTAEAALDASACRLSRPCRRDRSRPSATRRPRARLRQLRAALAQLSRPHPLHDGTKLQPVDGEQAGGGGAAGRALDAAGRRADEVVPGALSAPLTRPARASPPRPAPRSRPRALSSASSPPPARRPPGRSSR